MHVDQIEIINIHFPDLDIHTYPTKAYNGKGMLSDEIKKTGLDIKSPAERYMSHKP